MSSSYAAWADSTAMMAGPIHQQCLVATCVVASIGVIAGFGAPNYGRCKSRCFCESAVRNNGACSGIVGDGDDSDCCDYRDGGPRDAHQGALRGALHGALQGANRSYLAAIAG